MGYDETEPADDNQPFVARIFIESVAACISALSVSPAISIIDKAIVSNASGVETLGAGIYNGVKTMITRPIYFLKQPSFVFIFGVYSGTYVVANSIEAICERSKRSSFYPKFIGSSVANVTLSVLKDKAFASMFGKGPPRPLPALSYALFAARDSSTILASFSLPGLISVKLQKDQFWSKGTADTTAQLFTPVAMQILSTPLFLNGLDLYNRSVATTAERISFVKTEYFKTVLARMARIFPAYGVGGVINKYFRKVGKNMLRDHYRNTQSIGSQPSKYAT